MMTHFCRRLNQRPTRPRLGQLDVGFDGQARDDSHHHESGSRAWWLDEKVRPTYRRLAVQAPPVRGQGRAHLNQPVSHRLDLLLSPFCDHSFVQ